MTDTRRLVPPSREQWLHSLDARHHASSERSRLWPAACCGEITYAELQQRIAELRQQHVNSHYVTRIERTAEGALLHMVDGSTVRSSMQFHVVDGKLTPIEPLDDDDDCPF